MEYKLILYQEQIHHTGCTGMFSFPLCLINIIQMITCSFFSTQNVFKYDFEMEIYQNQDQKMPATVIFNKNHMFLDY